MKRIRLRASVATAPLARLVLGLGMLTAIVSCTDDGPMTPPAALASVQTEAARAQEVARGIALALANRDVREAVRDAMRASLWTEHKLPFKEFAATPAGAALIEAAARARSISLDAFRRELESLPSLDFYMPIREHRRTWAAGENLVVVAAWDGRGDAPGYMPDGRVMAVSRTSAEGLPPLFFIQPSQRKGLRVRPQPNTRGLVIEDANDGVASEVFVWRSGQGDSTVIDMALPDAAAKLEALRVRIAESERRSLLGPSIIEVCEPEQINCDYPVTPQPGPADTTRLATFVHFTCDHTWCYEAGEFRFDAYLRPARLVLLPTSGSYYREGIPPHSLQILNVSLIFGRLVNGTDDYLNVHITEQDRGDFLGFNLDDDCGTVTLRWYDNGVTKYYPNKTSSQTNDCHGTEFGFAHSMEATYRWTPKTAY